MDFSYIEDESIHIRLPYSSEPHIAINKVFKDCKRSEQQSFRSSDAGLIEENDIHHQHIPYWTMIPSKCTISAQSRPNTSANLIPLKKHLLEESVYFEEDEKKNDQFIENLNFLYYGETGKILIKAFNCESNLESTVLEEFSKDPKFVACVAEDCIGSVAKEFTMLNKILIDLMVEYWKEKDSNKLCDWAKAGKEFYSSLEFPIFTNFIYEGVLLFERKEDYIEYFEKLCYFQ